MKIPTLSKTISEKDGTSIRFQFTELDWWVVVLGDCPSAT